MASTTSVISLFVLLLATYCYSVPVGHEYDITTARNELPTEKIMTEYSSMSTDLPLEQTTVHSMMHHKRKDNDHDHEAHESHESHELTTSTVESTSEVMPKRSTDDDDRSGETSTRIQEVEQGRGEDKKRGSDEGMTLTTAMYESTSEMMPKRTVGDDDRSDETTPVGMEYPKRGISLDDMTTEFMATSERPHEERTIEDDSFTTMESSTQFNDRVTRIEEEEAKHDDRFDGMDKSTIESTSSLDSFGKSTGFLRHDEDEEKPRTTKYESGHRVIKTETIIPGKITETKIYSGVPSRTYVVDEPMTTESSRLSQGETLSHSSKIKSNY